MPHAPCNRQDGCIMMQCRDMGKRQASTGLNNYHPTCYEKLHLKVYQTTASLLPPPKLQRLIGGTRTRQRGGCQFSFTRLDAVMPPTPSISRSRIHLQQSSNQCVVTLGSVITNLLLAHWQAALAAGPVT
jgi:hypothetical protein